MTFFNNFKQTKFDSILQYVVFPAITLKKDKEILPPCGFFRSYEELYKSNTIGRNDFLFFFAWLSTEKGVKQIIKLVVDDFENPHSDDIIEKCLSLFDIDVLNWSKADLDPEILCTACPRVREIQLRWGGNNAILRAWSERDGLPRLKDLQKITLDYDEVNTKTRSLESLLRENFLMKDRFLTELIDKLRTSEHVLVACYLRVLQMRANPRFDQSRFPLLQEVKGLGKTLIREHCAQQTNRWMVRRTSGWTPSMNLLRSSTTS